MSQVSSSASWRGWHSPETGTTYASATASRAASSLRPFFEPPATALYEYSFAAGTIFAYGILIGLTFLIARAYERSGSALGLRSFEWRWVGTAIGLIVLVLILASALEPVLHGGRDQGLSPDDWQPDRAGAFALNGVIVSTITAIAVAYGLIEKPF